MLEKKFITENLQKTFCYKCGSTLEGAKLITISEAPIMLIAHATCQICQAESLVTVTLAGSGTIPLQSDLTGEEFKKFMGAKPVTYDELLDLHNALKKQNIWNLLDIKETLQEKEPKK